mmetsp:Transcript_8520/g.34648  ORF Transcript_8520/g.34648 Transcript_8520/m.34648 type:complete len:202 (+) Transcript_8520:646-1251(+)
MFACSRHTVTYWGAPPTPFAATEPSSGKSVRRDARSAFLPSKESASSRGSTSSTLAVGSTRDINEPDSACPPPFSPLDSSRGVCEPSCASWGPSRPPRCLCQLRCNAAEPFTVLESTEKRTSVPRTSELSTPSCDSKLTYRVSTSTGATSAPSEAAAMCGSVTSSANLFSFSTRTLTRAPSGSQGMAARATFPRMSSRRGW